MTVNVSVAVNMCLCSQFASTASKWPKKAVVAVETDQQTSSLEKTKWRTGTSLSLAMQHQVQAEVGITLIMIWTVIKTYGLLLKYCALLKMKNWFLQITSKTTVNAQLYLFMYVFILFIL